MKLTCRTTKNHSRNCCSGDINLQKQNAKQAIRLLEEQLSQLKNEKVSLETVQRFAIANAQVQEIKTNYEHEKKVDSLEMEIAQVDDDLWRLRFAHPTPNSKRG